MKKQNLQMILWIAALIVGGILGVLGIEKLNDLFNFIATAFTRLFQFLAVPTIALAVITTFASFGKKKNTGRIFRHAVSYTLLTTFAAAIVAVLLYFAIAPENLPAEAAAIGSSDIPQNLTGLSYYEHFLSVIPNNMLQPFLVGNVLSVLFIAFAIGVALSRMPDSDTKETVVRFFTGFQELLFMLIRGLIKILPIGIVAFSAQLTAQISAGVIIGSIGKYVLVVMCGNLLQFFIILPLFLIARGLNPLKVLKQMMPAVLTALFTKSSAATLPVTMRSAEERMNANPEVARFVLPICTTINMNGCAAFILVTSLFVMQNGGVALTLPTVLLWILIAVMSAIGNAGVPMGCYFLTLSLMAGTGMPVGIMGIILPIYAIIDMVETAENVWSDSCVCAMTNKDIYGKK